MLTDERVLDVYMRTQSYAAAGRELGISNEGVRVRIRTMVSAGIKVPIGNVAPAQRKYPPKRVAELNEYIKRKTT